ncbi:MAG: diacylglycerol kinase family protein [Chloroflexi bacterium]|nr:diacylglycerol kinase family protein [Chloroflexota bacterium]
MGSDEPRSGIHRHLVAPLSRTLRSFPFALEGISHVARTQPNWRIHVVAAAVAIGAGVALQVSAAEMAVLVLTSGLVLGLEAMNTAVEAAVDAAGGPPSTAAKHAKDVAAGAVLIAAIAAAVVGGLVFGPRIVGWVRG